MNSQITTNPGTEYSNYWEEQNLSGVTNVMQPNVEIQQLEKTCYRKKLKLKFKIIECLSNLLVSKQSSSMSIAHTENKKYQLSQEWKVNIEIISCQLSLINDSLMQTIVSENIEEDVHALIANYLQQIYSWDSKNIADYQLAKQKKIYLTYHIRRLIKGKQQKQCFNLIYHFLQKCLQQEFTQQEKQNENVKQQQQQQSQLASSHQAIQQKQHQQIKRQYNDSPKFQSPKKKIPQFSFGSSIEQNQEFDSSNTKNKQIISQFGQILSQKQVKYSVQLKLKKEKPFSGRIKQLDQELMQLQKKKTDKMISKMIELMKHGFNSQ